MDTLFPDSETFQKERPTTITEQQRQDYYRKVAQEIIDNGWSQYDIDSVIEDVSNMSHHDSGYELAKWLEEFDRSASYEIDTPFIEFLDDFGWGIAEIVLENVQAWVVETNPQPKYQKGQKLLIETALDYEHKKGLNVYVTGFSSQKNACYLIDEDPNRNGGTIIPYEKVESRCSVIE